MNQKFEYLNHCPEIEIRYKSKTKASDRIKITSPITGADVFREMFNADTIDYQEEFIMLLMNRANQVIGYYKVAQGGMVATVVDVRTIFSVALKAGATNIMIAHNHPTGNVRPSDADKRITEQVRNAGKIMDIHLLDHIIITGEDYYSFANEGLI